MRRLCLVAPFWEGTIFDRGDRQKNQEEKNDNFVIWCHQLGWRIRSAHRRKPSFTIREYSKRTETFDTKIVRPHARNMCILPFDTHSHTHTPARIAIDPHHYLWLRGIVNEHPYRRTLPFPFEASERMELENQHKTPKKKKKRRWFEWNPMAAWSSPNRSRMSKSLSFFNSISIIGAIEETSNLVTQTCTICVGRSNEQSEMCLDTGNVQ